MKPREAPVLGLTLAPASALAGSGAPGVVTTEIDPTATPPKAACRPATSSWMSACGAYVAPIDVRKFVEEARAQSKKSVLLRVMRGDMMVFAAVPIG